VRYQRIDSRSSSLASGWNRNGLLAIGELFCHFSKNLFPRNRLYPSQSHVFYTPFDLFIPRGLNPLFDGSFVEAFNQLMDEHAAIVSRKGESFLQDFRNLWSPLRHSAILHLGFKPTRRAERVRLDGQLLSFQHFTAIQSP
jgi:hypothetical protein